jgi:hypothetical protein
MRFSRDPSRYSIGSYVCFPRGSHMREQYHQWTTLLTWNPNSRSKMWGPLGLTLRRMPYGRGTLRIPLWRFSEQGRPALLLYAKHEEHDNQPNSQVGNPFGIPSCAVLHSLAGLLSCKEKSVQGFLWVKKVWFAFTQQTFAPETFGKRRKASCFEKPMRSVPEIFGVHVWHTTS